MIKNFIFDMGNVLMDFSPDYILSQYFDDLETIARLKNTIFYSKMWKEIDNGDLSFEQGAHQVTTTHPEFEAKVIHELFSSWYKYKRENKTMTQLVKKLKNHGYKIYLCSNAAELFYSYKDNYEVFEFFDGLLVSAEINISKPDIRIFQYLLNNFKLEAHECLFIDDSLANIEAAYKVGIYGYHFNGNSSLFTDFLKSIHIL